MDLANSLGEFVDSRIRTDFHWAEIVSHSSSPSRAVIKVSGSTSTISDVPYIHSYNPNNGDIVLVAVVRGDMFILGNMKP